MENTFLMSEIVYFPTEKIRLVMEKLKILLERCENMEANFPNFKYRDIRSKSIV